MDFSVAKAEVVCLSEGGKKTPGDEASVHCARTRWK